MRITVQNGSDFQMWTTIDSESASGGSFNQLGPSSRVSRKIVELMMPHSGLSMKRNDRMVGIDGRAQGRMKTMSSALIHHRGWMKKPDSFNARSIFTFTTMARKSVVLTTDRVKIEAFRRASWVVEWRAIHRP